MPVKFDKLILGEAYDRPYLAKLWNYKDWQALARGVVTPANTDIVILFITKEKQKHLTQYEDHFEGQDLKIQGEENHVNDDRIIQAHKNKDHIYLFYRERHHQPFPCPMNQN